MESGKSKSSSSSCRENHCRERERKGARFLELKKNDPKMRRKFERDVNNLLAIGHFNDFFSMSIDTGSESMGTRDGDVYGRAGKRTKHQTFMLDHFKGRVNQVKGMASKERVFKDKAKDLLEKAFDELNASKSRFRGIKVANSGDIEGYLPQFRRIISEVSRYN